MPRRANLCQHRHAVALSPIRQWVCGSSPNFGSNLSSGLLQQINQVLLIPVFFACLGSFFPRNYYSGLSIICTQVYQMVAALTTVAWWFGQFPYIVRRTPHPELGPTCEFRLCHAFTASRRRPASTLTSAPGHISFITHFA